MSRTLTHDRSDGRRQRHEAKRANERAAVPEPLVPTIAELREYLGNRLFELTGLDGAGDDPCDTEYLRERYFSEGGLARFLSEGFPNSTSLKPFGAGQLRAIGIVESVIRNGGVEQSLEPRGFAKSSRVARSAIWAVLGGFRRCGIIFQSSEPKSIETLAKIRNEFAASPFLRALSPGICTAARHAQHSPVIARQQHYRDEPTNISWLKASIRLPDILGETGGGARLVCMPFAKAAGAVFSDPETLEDIRPDLLLPDDVQSHDDTSSPRVTEKLLSIWNGSVRYLCGRGKSAATIFTQTIFESEDMADQLSRDPSVHTVKYPFLVRFPDDLAWWQGEYRHALLGYDPLDPDGQVRARGAANELYRMNRERADKGAEVSWEHAFDPATAISAIQQALNNFLINETAFWAQDQNTPEAIVSQDDIRAKPSEIMAKQHVGKRGVVPDFAGTIVVHVDVHDDLLYYGVCAGSDTMQMALIDRQTWPPQKQKYFKHNQAFATFDSIAAYRDLPTVQDKIRAALNDLVEHLTNAVTYATADGTQYKISALGIDCGSGSHWDTVHSFARDAKSSIIIPMRGTAPTAAERPLNARPRAANEKRRGDCWIEKLSPRTKVRWLEFDSSYYKQRLHKGFKMPIGTSESVSLWETSDERIHAMLADHCYSEAPTWTTARKANDITSGTYTWTLKAGQDNHILDNLTGCLALLNHSGSTFSDVKPLHGKRRRISGAEVARLRARANR